MVVAHNLTTKRDIVKPLQYVGETDVVTTPANYATTPNSATFILVGNNTEINPQPDIPHSDAIVLGSEDIIDAVKNGSLYTFSLRFNPIDKNLIRYGWDAAGGGAASIDESLSFTYSYRLDGTENFQHVRGALPTSTTLTLDKGVWEAEMQFIAKDITIPNTTDGNPGTPVYLSSETTSQMLGQSDVGTTPFTWNTVNFGERRFSVTVTRDLSVMTVNGELDIVYAKAAARGIVFSADVFTKNTTLLTDFEAKTKQAASYVFSTSPAVTMTFTNAVITGWTQTPQAGSTDGLIESITARAESVTDL